MKIFMIILALVVSLIAVGPWKRLVTSEGDAIRYAINAEPTTFIERRTSGEQIAHKLLHVKIQVPATDEVSKLENLARRIMDHSMKLEADKQGIEMVWVTFYRLDDLLEIQERVKTYREIYIRQDENWRRIEKNKAKDV